MSTPANSTPTTPPTFGYVEVEGGRVSITVKEEGTVWLYPANKHPRYIAFREVKYRTPDELAAMLRMVKVPADEQERIMGRVAEMLTAVQDHAETAVPKVTTGFKQAEGGNYVPYVVWTVTGRGVPPLEEEQPSYISPQHAAWVAEQRARAAVRRANPTADFERFVSRERYDPKDLEHFKRSFGV